MMYKVFSCMKCVEVSFDPSGVIIAIATENILPPILLLVHDDYSQVSHKGDPYFHKGIPIFPGKWGPGVPILRGSPFSHDTGPLFFGPHVHAE